MNALTPAPRPQRRLDARHKTCDLNYILFSISMATACSGKQWHLFSVPAQCQVYLWLFSQMEEESWTILSIGKPFMYNIPNFVIMSIELGHIKVEVANNGLENNDAFIHCDM